MSESEVYALYPRVKGMPFEDHIVAALIKWYELNHYHEAIQLGRKYLRGEIHATPKQFMTISQETIPLLNSMHRLHDFGLLTVGSQPGGLQEDDESGSDYSDISQEEILQTPYLEFLIPQLHIKETAVKTFTDLLFEHPDLHVMLGDFTTEPPTQISTFEGVYTTAESRRAKTADELQQTPWRDGLYFSSPLQGKTVPSVPRELWPGVCKAIENARPKKYTVIVRWNRDVDLNRVIEEAAISVGIPKQFSEFGP